MEECTRLNAGFVKFHRVLPPIWKDILEMKKQHGSLTKEKLLRLTAL